jgi:hypothetical protein
MTSPNIGAYNNAATTVGTTPTLIATLGGVGSGGVLVQNNGTATIYLGSSSVASSGANMGISLATAATLLVPTVGGPADGLYAVTASSTASVVVLFPTGA